MQRKRGEGGVPNKDYRRAGKRDGVPVKKRTVVDGDLDNVYEKGREQFESLRTNTFGVVLGEQDIDSFYPVESSKDISFKINRFATKREASLVIKRVDKTKKNFEIEVFHKGENVTDRMARSFPKIARNSLGSGFWVHVHGLITSLESEDKDAIIT